VTNVLVYFVLQGGGIASGPDGGDLVGVGSFPDLIAALFQHSGIVQLLGNMLFLWMFGATVEDSTSRVRYLLFYLLGGLAAFGLSVVVASSATVPAIGSSGAVAAVLGGYILLYPRGRVVAVVLLPLVSTLLEVPAWALMALWFGEQALVAATSLGDVSGEAGGVAWFASAGGFLFGLLAIRLVATRRKQLPSRVREALL
jgi:membrane associated rhomboid family serine protease